MTRILLLVLVGLLIAGCSGDREGTDNVDPETESEVQSKRIKNHTNPPIVIGNGSIKWYESQEEELRKCPDNPCAQEYTCVTNLDQNYNKGWCVKELPPGNTDTRIFDADGNCTTYKDTLPVSFVGYGTAEAKHGELAIFGRRYTIESDNYELTLEIGEQRGLNVWTLRKDNRSCTLSSARPVEGIVPWELGQLATLKKSNGNEITTSIWFATCEHKNCDDE